MTQGIAETANNMIYGVLFFAIPILILAVVKIYDAVKWYREKKEMWSNGKKG